MARSRARARVACSAQGQPRGRCKVSLRAERVSRPAREKKRRRRVLVVTSCSPRPMRAAQLWLRDHVEPRVRTRTFEGYRGITQRHIIPKLSASGIASMRLRRLARWRMVMEKRTFVLRQTATTAWV